MTAVDSELQCDCCGFKRDKSTYGAGETGKGEKT